MRSQADAGRGAADRHHAQRPRFRRRARSQQYNAAVEAYKAGQYAEAEGAIQSVPRRQPTHRLTADAIFFPRRDLFAALAPARGGRTISERVDRLFEIAARARGMMRLGQSLAMLGNAEQACATFAEVGKRYPAAAAR